MAGFGKFLKSLVVEEDTVKVTSANVTPAIAGSVTPVAPITVSDDDEVYQKINAATAFANTKVGKAITKFLNAMAALPLDESMKLKTAAAQAKSLDGLTDTEILTAFTEMKDALAHEQVAFNTAIEAAKSNEVEARKVEIQKLSEEIVAKQAEITSLQAQVSDLSTALAEAQGKIVRVQTQFSMAATRRGQEIDSEKARLAALIG